MVDELQVACSNASAQCSKGELAQGGSSHICRMITAAVVLIGAYKKHFSVML